MAGPPACGWCSLAHPQPKTCPSSGASGVVMWLSNIPVDWLLDRLTKLYFFVGKLFQKDWLFTSLLLVELNQKSLKTSSSIKSGLGRTRRHVACFSSACAATSTVKLPGFSSFRSSAISFVDSAWWFSVQSFQRHLPSTSIWDSGMILPFGREENSSNRLKPPEKRNSADLGHNPAFRETTPLASPLTCS